MRKLTIAFTLLASFIASSGILCAADRAFPSTAQATPDQSYDDLYNKAFESYDKGEYNNALLVFNEAFKLDKGITDAPYMIGRCYYRINDFKKAVEWFKYAADRGDKEATYYLALCYEEGKGVVHNENEALRLYEIVANSNSELKTNASQKVEILRIAKQAALRPRTNQTFTVNGVSFTMVYVEGGTFTMGATKEQGRDADSEERPTHQVTLSGFSIGQTEVTQALWQAVMGSNPSWFIGDLQQPVEKVSWDDCQTFITKLNQLTGQNFRLPTEAEWEYAARGGTKSQGYKYSGSKKLGDVAWYSKNSGSTTHAVGTKSANELGLYDMSGNVWEWCQDWYGDYSADAQSNPTGPTSSSDRVCRGGGWVDFNGCRVSCRLNGAPSFTNFIIGLRLAL